MLNPDQAELSVVGGMVSGFPPRRMTRSQKVSQKCGTFLCPFLRLPHLVFLFWQKHLFKTVLMVAANHWFAFFKVSNFLKMNHSTEEPVYEMNRPRRQRTEQQHFKNENAQRM
jgi:hypothetical protein